MLTGQWCSLCVIDLHSLIVIGLAQRIRRSHRSLIMLQRHKIRVFRLCLTRIRTPISFDS